MRTFRIGLTVVACLIVICISACAQAGAQPPTAATATTTPVVMPSATAVSMINLTPNSPDETGGGMSVNFDASNFDHANNITNTWMSFKPGMKLTYDGMAHDDSGNLVAHRIVIQVTDLIKTIAGVDVLITFDQDYSANKLEESELAFYAQDKNSNVWLMGEYPEAYDENGKLVEAPTWIQGIQDAKAGIIMLADPQTGTSSYAEGWGPAVSWSDRGQVDQMGQRVCVAAGCYQNVLVIAEYNATETNAQQLKYYARNVGNIKVGWRGTGEKTQETLELSKVEQLDADGLAAIRDGALKLEQSAYQNSKDVYALTTPAHPGN